MQNEVMFGRVINVTATKAVSGGDLLTVGSIVAVASTDIAIGDTGACAVLGCFELDKDTAAITQGAAVYLSADGKATATKSDTFVGTAWEAAAAGDSTVIININFGRPATA